MESSCAEKRSLSNNINKYINNDNNNIINLIGLINLMKIFIHQSQW